MFFEVRVAQQWSLVNDDLDAGSFPSHSLNGEGNSHEFESSLLGCKHLYISRTFYLLLMSSTIGKMTLTQKSENEWIEAEFR